MATSEDFIEFISEQITGAGAIRPRKMFGEYMVYVDDKPLLLVCDNTVYIKKHDAVAALLADAETGAPYSGAKEHYILDIEDRDLALAVIAALLPVVPVPVKKERDAQKKQKKAPMVKKKQTAKSAAAVKKLLPVPQPVRRTAAKRGKSLLIQRISEAI